MRTLTRNERRELKLEIRRSEFSFDMLRVIVDCRLYDKKGKPCAICGKRLVSELMMVAHKVPVSELSDYDALYDTTNWEVRCIFCERALNHEKDVQDGEDSSTNDLSK